MASHIVKVDDPGEVFGEQECQLDCRHSSEVISNGFGKRDSGLSDREICGRQTEARSVPEEGCRYGVGSRLVEGDPRSRTRTCSATSGGKLVGGFGFGLCSSRSHVLGERGRNLQG